MINNSNISQPKLHFNFSTVIIQVSISAIRIKILAIASRKGNMLGKIEHTYLSNAHYNEKQKSTKQQ